MKSIELSIPTPCSENWNTMTPSENGKFCGRCEKIVVDLSTKGDAELVRLFKDQPDSICARIPRSKLNIPLTTHPVFNETSFSLKALVVGTALLTSLNSFAENEIMYSDTISLVQSIVDDTLLPAHATIHGSNLRNIALTVLDETNGQPVPLVAIYLLDSNDLTIARIKSDFEGNAMFKLSEDQFQLIHSIQVKMPEIEDQLFLWDELKHSIPIQLNVRTFSSQEVFIVGLVYTEKPKKRTRRQKREARRMRRSD